MTAELYVAKRDFRSMVWGQMERGKLLQSQRNSRHRLPYFIGSDEAAQKIADTEEFKNCKTVVINSDSAQEALRVLALKCGKSVFVPVAHVNYGGAFCQLVLPAEAELSDELLLQAARAASVGETADSTLCRQVTVEQMPNIDLFVVGSVAVSKQGYRIGQGDGHSDMDYAVIRTAGRISDSTLVLTCVHDEQVFDRLPGELFGPHDVAVDVIATPTALLRISNRLTKPSGIIWSLIVPNRVKPACVIRSLMQKQIDNGVDVELSEECDNGGRGGWRGRFRGSGGRFRGFGGGRYYRRVFRPSRPAPAADISGAEGEVRPLMAQRQPVQKAPQPTVPVQQADPESRPRRQWSGRRRRANTAPSEHSDAADRSNRRRADESCCVRLKLLPLDSRRCDLRAALDALSLSATIHSFSMGDALLQFPSAEAARRLTDVGSVTVQGRRVPVRTPGRPERRYCVHVNGAAVSLSRLRLALAKLGFDQVFARRTGPAAYSVELPDQQTVDSLLEQSEQVSTALGDSITLTEARARDAVERKKHAAKTTSTETGDSGEGSSVAIQEAAENADNVSDQTVSADKEHSTSIVGAETEQHAADQQGRATDTEPVQSDTDHTSKISSEATEKLTNGPIAEDGIVLSEETPDDCGTPENELVTDVPVENGICSDGEPSITDPLESVRIPPTEEDVIVSTEVQPNGATSPGESSGREVNTTALDVTPTAVEVTPSASVEVTSSTAAEVTPPAAVDVTLSAAVEEDQGAAADPCSDSDSFTSAELAATAPLVNGHCSPPSGGGDSCDGPLPNPVDRLKDCPAPITPVSGDAPNIV